MRGIVLREMGSGRTRSFERPTIALLLWIALGMRSIRQSIQKVSKTDKRIERLFVHKCNGFSDRCRAHAAETIGTIASALAKAQAELTSPEKSPVAAICTDGPGEN
jgi:hypothetical protein